MLLELALQFKVYPNIIGQWKWQLIEPSAQLFLKAGKGNAEAEASKHKTDQLFRQIGQFQVENDYFKKVKAANGTELKLSCLISRGSPS